MPSRPRSHGYQTIPPLAKHRKELDPIARMFAQSVQHHLLPVGTPGRPELTGRPADLREITGKAVSATVTTLRAVMDDGSVRVFTVKLIEAVTERQPAGSEPKSVRDAYDGQADKSGRDRTRPDEATWTP